MEKTTGLERFRSGLHCAWMGEWRWEWNYYYSSLFKCFKWVVYFRKCITHTFSYTYDQTTNALPISMNKRCRVICICTFGGINQLTICLLLPFSPSKFFSLSSNYCMAGLNAQTVLKKMPQKRASDSLTDKNSLLYVMDHVHAVLRAQASQLFSIIYMVSQHGVLSVQLLLLNYKC